MGDDDRDRKSRSAGYCLLVAWFLVVPSAHATTFTVTSTSDTGGTTCAATCTLRQAINAANIASGADAIQFNISGAGVHSIKPATVLPTILGPVTIDGYTQSGSSVNTASVGSNAVLQVEIDGSSLASGGSALAFGAGSGPSTVRGLIINNFRTGASFAGVGIKFAQSATGGAVKGCFVGTDATGKIANPNSSGIVIASGYTGITIGGTALADRNVIAGNIGNGIELDADSNVVQGNLIGVVADGGSLLGNGADGVLSQASGNVVGGTAAGAGNVIAGNLSTGVAVTGAATGVTIEGNAIYGNGQLGIDLSADGVTANDAGDADSGDNHLQNYPVLTAAGLGSGLLGIQGSLNSTASRAFRVEFFVSDAVDSSGFGEGRRFLGSRNVSTDAAGNASFTAIGSPSGVTSREVITATATDTVTGDTSEFSAGVVVASTTTVTNTNDSGDGSLRQAILNANANPGTDVIDFAIPGSGVHVIHLSSVLPTITDTVTIDGYTQLGASANTLVDGSDAVILVQLDGSAFGDLSLNAGLAICASASTVRGLSIGGFNAGIAVAQNDQTPCASAPSSVAIEGNFIGVAPDGITARPNVGNAGIVVSASTSARIGGTSPAQRNVVSGNATQGIIVVGGATGMAIDGNYIGTDASGTQARGNELSGITLSFPLSGAVVGGAAPNLVAFNGAAGILVLSPSKANTIARNNVHDNAGLGIDLCAVLFDCPDGVTPNDVDDADGGGNNLQNFPVITAVARTPTGLSISGSLDRPATATSLTFAIGVYANTVCDPSGFGEGERYLGSFDFVSANAGVETFANIALPTTAPLPAGTKITLTATDPAGNTSEFSQCAELDAGAQTFVVNSILDIDDENCTAAVDGCTLREAINAANARVGADFITFNIPGSGVHVITLTGALPTILDTVTIDGYTQAGAAPNTLADGDNAKIQVQLDGIFAPSNAFLLAVCANDTTLSGLSITRFAQAGVIVGDSSAGVFCGGQIRNVRIAGNFIGLAPDGSAPGGQNNGVFVNASVVRVGGSAPGERNIVSGNGSDGGIVVTNTGATGTAILGNYIGTDPSGTLDRGNLTGGVSILNGVSGVSVGGTTPNRIAFNGNGIVVGLSSRANVLFANDLFSNDALAIDLLAGGVSPDGATANDTDDADTGGDDLQNFPVLASAVQDGPVMRLAGSLDVPAGNTQSSYSLAFYANSTCSDGARGQGELYLGYANVALSGAAQDFNVALPVTAAIGSRISSTATSAGGTSEFSTCVTLTPGDHIFANGFE